MLIISTNSSGNSSCSMDSNMDIFVRTSVHGIRNPYNSHSFSSAMIYIPTTCVMCARAVSPLSSTAVRCLACRITVHRECMRSTDNICGASSNSKENGFIINDTNTSTCAAIAGGNINSTDYANAIKTQATNDDIATDNTSSASSMILSMRELVSNAKTTVMTTFSSMHTRLHHHHDPDQKKHIPGQSALPSLPSTTNTNNTINATNATNSCIWRGALRQVADSYKQSWHTSTIPVQANKLEYFVKSIMKDDSSFPGRAGVILRSMYIDMQFNSAEDTLCHALRCLDSISYAFFLNYNDKEIESSVELVNTITNSIDKHVLGAYSGSMYKKIFQATEILSHDEDIRLHDIIGKKTRSSSVLTSKNKQNAMICLHSIKTKMTASDKLSCLTLALEHLSRSDDDSSDTSDSNNGQNMSIDADSMIQRLECLLFEDISQYWTLWFAECAYINAMIRDDDGMLGVKGYSLVSLQQALDSLQRSSVSLQSVVLS